MESRSISCAMPRATACAVGHLRHSEPPSAQSWVIAVGRVGVGRFARDRLGLGDLRRATSASIASSSAFRDAGLEQPLSLRGDRVAGQPGLDLFLRPVRARIGARMAAVAVGHRLDERRAARRNAPGRSSGEPWRAPPRRRCRRRRAARARTPRRGRPPARSTAVTDADGRVLHVLVVLADEDDRRLPHDRQVQRLVEGADVRRAVAEEADRDLAASRGTAPTRLPRPRSAGGRRRSRTSPSRRARRW